jgi:hypothetical protein
MSLHGFLARSLKIAALASALVACSELGEAEAAVPCVDAHRRVQAYFARVKAFADTEAYRNIPMRCGPNWQCGHWWIGRLNLWYGRQIERVRMWHAEIDRQCYRPTPVPAPQTAPMPQRRAPVPASQTVQIEIPTTPEGFRP